MRRHLSREQEREKQVTLQGSRNPFVTAVSRDILKCITGCTCRSIWKLSSIRKNRQRGVGDWNRSGAKWVDYKFYNSWIIRVSDRLEIDLMILIQSSHLYIPPLQCPRHYQWSSKIAIKNHYPFEKSDGYKTDLGHKKQAKEGERNESSLVIGQEKER